MPLKSLNPVQREAAAFGDGPLLILAGAGSGKTRVLTSRIAHLVMDKDVRPENILAVTFTNKAAGEMRERLSELIGPEARELWLGTFHSLGLRVLRREASRAGLTRELTVYGDDEQLRLVKEILKELSLSDKSNNPRSILWRINQAKNENLSPEEFAGMATDFLSERVAKIYSMYQKRLREMNALDFGDLITEPIKLLEANPELLERYSRAFRHVLVDEYQDTNKSQYLLTRILGSVNRNLFAVGDPDQSIYAWRGADITNILDFEKDYPEATVMRLEQNYRSTSTILKAANSVIRNNTRRMEKELWTENPDGEKISYQEAVDEHAEARGIIKRLRELVSTGGHSYGGAAVFYRTNAQSRVFEEELIREGIPYTVVGGVRFYDRAEIRDAVAYLRVAANPRDAISLKRVVNTPARGVGKATMEKVEKLAEELGVNLFDAFAAAADEGLVRKKKKLTEFLDAYRAFKEDTGKLALHELTLRLLEDSGYMFMYQEEGTEEAYERVNNLFEFVSAIKDFEEAEPEAGLAEFLDHVSLISDLDGYSGAADRLTLMTIHSAKGLEFKSVFLAGMEEGLFPHSRSIDDPDQLEEERRLCYVAMTRARERLFISSARMRTVYGERRHQVRSRFLDEISAEYMDAPLARPGDQDDAGDVYTDEPYYTTEDSQVNYNDDWSYTPEAAPAAPAAPAGATGAGAEWRVGMKVMHPSFGLGVIRARTGTGPDAKLTINFQGQGVKKLALRHAVLKPLA